MISRFLKRKTAAPAPVAPRTPEGTTVWAVGDIHGCLDLLKALVEAIVEDTRKSSAQKTIVVFLGDYVDRGPDSRGVIRYLAGLGQDELIEWHFLKGNHEDTMLQFLTDPRVGQQWCEYGGNETLESYGLRAPQIRHKVEAWAHLAADLDHRLEPNERRFLEQLELSVTIGGYFFAHAGARPGESLERQTSEDLMWIRRTFLDSAVGFDRVVVHGHTPEADVHSDARRVGVDTKAYESGVLTALRLSGSVRETFQTTRLPVGGAIVVRRSLLPAAETVLARASLAGAA